jgi:hypothetical protein
MNKAKIYLRIIVGIVLLFFWIGLIFYQSFQIEKVFTVLTREYYRNEVSELPNGEIYQGTKIVAEFTATENNLGIIGFRFWTYYRLNDDYLIFRIREKNSLDWYYQNRYKADQFQPNQYFTFGFPVIENSKGKQYVFQIESSQGRPGIAVGVSEIDPVFITKFKYPRDLITSSTSQFLWFVRTKLINLLTKAEFKASSFIYLIPFLLYLLSFTPAYSSFETKFKLFIRDRLKFASQLTTQVDVEADNVIDIIFKRIFKFILTQYKQTSTIFDKLKFVFDMISTPIILAIFYLVRLFLRRPDILSIVIMIIGSTSDALFIKSGDATILVLIVLWVYSIAKYHLTDKLFFILALTFLAGSAILYYSRWPFPSERTAAWAWIFLSIMVIINMIQLKNNGWQES